MSTAYYSRELAYLQKAQSDLKLSNTCKTITLSTNGGTAGNIINCASIASDALLKFQAAWDNQTANYNNRKSFTQSIRLVFGDLDEACKTIRRLGWIPFLVTLGVVIGMGVVIFRLLKRLGFFLKKGETPQPLPNDVQNTIIRVLAMFILLLILLPLSWTFGISARYEAMRLDATLKHDSGDSGGDDFKVYNNPSFGKIWKACNTKALRQVYNCSQGLNPTDGLDDVPDDIKGSTCVQGAPNKMSADQETLRIGLQALVDTNLSDFDAVAILQSINNDIVKLKGILAPQASSSSKLSATQSQAVVLSKIVPTLAVPSFKPLGLDDRTAKQAAFINAVDQSLVPSVAEVLLSYWPQVNPEMYMDAIDNALSTYYNTNAAGFYEDYIRDYAMSVLRNAMQSVASSLKGDGRFASITQFTRVNWPRVVANMTTTKAVVADLFTNICRYTDTFVPNDRPSQSMGYDLTKMYINCALVIIVMFLLIFLTYMIFVKDKDKLAAATQSWVGGDATWYARMDLIKHVLLGIAVAMFIMSVLVVIKNKAKSKAEHNNNALYYNSQRLKGAAWNLLMTIYPINCNDQALKSNDPVAFNACSKGGTKFASTGVPPTVNPNTFYTSAVNVILAYERCNLVTQNNKVPFPTAEFIVVGVFLLVCVGGLVFLSGLTAPVQKIKDIRDMLRLREKLSMLTAGIPSSIAAELQSKIMCSEVGADVLRILSFSFVVLLFILNAVLVTSFNKSAQDYQSALNTMSADMCI